MKLVPLLLIPILLTTAACSVTRGSVSTPTAPAEAPTAAATPTASGVAAKLAACYPPRPGCSACAPIPNHSIQREATTARVFINLPSSLYPKDILTGGYLTTVSGDAGIGWVSNGGPPGQALDAAPGCWSTYVEFTGRGEVDLRVPGVKAGVPDYAVRFIVN